MVYDHEKEKILNTVGFFVDQIFHFGSTSIPGMIAKPTVDILVIMKANVDITHFCELMMNTGYVCTKYPDHTKKRKNCMNFIVPYIFEDIEQYKCYIHIREHGVPYPEVIFYTYLREHKDIADEYIDLKKKLAKRYPNDREAYMKAKNDFIEKYTRIAVDTYKANKTINQD